MEKPEYSIEPHNNSHRDVDDRIAVDTDSSSLPSASVVVTTYNKLPLLKRCIAAVARQCDTIDYELVLVDDGSDDGTKEWAANVESEYPQLRGRFHYHWEEDNGYRLAHVRNVGLSIASNDVVVFLDADLIPAPGWLRGHLLPFSVAEDICVTGIYYNVDPTNLSLLPDVEELEANRVRDRWRGKMEDWREKDIVDSDNLNHQTHMPVWYMVCGGNTSYHRGRLVDVGGFDPNFKGWGAEDNDVAFRYYSNGNRILPSFAAVAYHQDHPFDKKKRQEQVEQNVKLLQSKTQTPCLTCVIRDREVFHGMEARIGRWSASVGGKVELVWAGSPYAVLPNVRSLRFASSRVVRGGLRKAISTARASAIMFPDSASYIPDVRLVEQAPVTGLAVGKHAIIYGTQMVWRNWPEDAYGVCHASLRRSILG
jgi:glycosyltransferase involved in cell wall biosynthesis